MIVIGSSSEEEEKEEGEDVGEFSNVVSYYI